MNEAGNMTMDPLEIQYLAFASALLDCMQERAQVEGIPTIARQRLQFAEDHSSVMSLQDLFLAPLAHRCLIASPDLSGMRAQCARSHWDAGIFQSPPIPPHMGALEVCDSFDQAQPQIGEALLQPILEVAKSRDSFALRPQDLIAAYREAKSSWIAPIASRRQTVPLLNFQSDITQRTSIGTNFELSPFTPDEKTEAYAHLGSPFSANLHEGVSLTGAQFKLFRVGGQEKRTRTVEQEIAAMTDTAGEIGDIITALRLLKAGSVSAPILVEIGDGKLPWGAFSMSRGVGVYAAPFPATYTLSAPEVAQVNHIYQSLRDLDAKREPRGGLDVALRYFNQSYARSSLEDRVIDLAIVIESTLLHKERDELKFRASLLGGALLSGQRQPKSTYERIKSLYDARSGIVHNGKALAELKKERSGLDPTQFCSECEELVRGILWAYVERLTRVKTQRDYGVSALNTDLVDHVVSNLRFS